MHWGAALCRSALQTASNPQADVWLKVAPQARTRPVRTRRTVALPDSLFCCAQAGFCGGKSGPAFVRDFLAWVKAVAAAFDSVLQSTPQLRSVLSGGTGARSALRRCV